MISVIIPAYNAEKTVVESINSVLGQTYSDFELIVINDGSTDRTLEVVEGIKGKDSRVKVFSYENAGGSVSRNRGAFLAKGEFISFLDADDIWTPDKLEMQLLALQKNPEYGVAYSWTDYINGRGEIVGNGSRVRASGDVYERLIENNFLENGSNPLIRTEIFIATGGFDNSLKAAQDWDMWLRLAMQSLFVYVPKVQVLYRISANSLSANIPQQGKYSLQVLGRSLLIKPVSCKTVKLSYGNLYKYLLCKSLQYPTRIKALWGLRFLVMLLINQPSRWYFGAKLGLKILVIFIFGYWVGGRRKNNRSIQAYK